MLPVKQGGLGFRNATGIALLGFNSSSLVVCPLVDAVLSCVSDLAHMEELAAAVLTWSFVYAGAGEPQALARLS